MDAIKEFIKPELVILVPVLYLIGMLLKNTKLIKDNYIPLILGIIGVILASVYSIATSTSSICSLKCLLMSIFVGITQGILTAGMSVYANQLIVVQPNKE